MNTGPLEGAIIVVKALLDLWCFPIGFLKTWRDFSSYLIDFIVE